MRDFDYIAAAISCIDNEIVNLLIEIHERNVKLNCLLESEKYDFSDFVKQAKIESVMSSVRMDFVYFSERMATYALEEDEPSGYQEKEVCGYNSALETVFKEKRTYTIADILLLNKHFENYDEKNKYFKIRDRDYTVHKGDRNGMDILTFEPVGFEEINEYIDLISPLSYNSMWNGEVDFLLVLPICILDLIKISPLRDISMQMSRLLMIAMMWGKHYQIGKYISLERIIEDSSDEYYQAIAESLEHWEDGFNNYKSFVKYILKVILKAFKEFEDRTKYFVVENMSKPERVEQYISEAKHKVTKKEIMYYCPDISETTIEIALRELKNAGVIEKIGGGRYTKYRYKR